MSKDVSATNPIGVDLVSLPTTLDALLARLDRLAPPFTSREAAYRQLAYIHRYVQRLGCKSILIEWHYIDRDHMEDHGVFYARAAHPYKNHCTRIHFFRVDRDDLKLKIEEILSELVKCGDGRDKVRIKEKELATESYLGFTVVKPLLGTPVGRTVLVPFPSDPPTRRSFPCTRKYSVHLLGIELQVRGLAFQQQDVGVSACATTALWSSLNNMQGHEPVSAATPAQITGLASRFSLPFGRSMPSEGLSIDQMCQAITALGLAPDLMHVGESGAEAKKVLHSALKSQFAPVVVLQEAIGGQDAHAVCLVGERANTRSLQESDKVVSEAVDGRTYGFFDDSSRYDTVYFHDDRFGPYLEGRVTVEGENLILAFENTKLPSEPERFIVTHILLPIHAKIHLSLSGLHRIAVEVVAGLHEASRKLDEGSTNAEHLRRLEASPPELTVWIEKSADYLANVIAASDLEAPYGLAESWSKLAAPRYCGLVRAVVQGQAIDVVLDCTSTSRNPRCLAVVAPYDSLLRPIGQVLAHSFQAELITLKT